MFLTLSIYLYIPGLYPYLKGVSKTRQLGSGRFYSSFPFCTLSFHRKTQRIGFPDPSLRLYLSPFTIHRKYVGNIFTAPTTVMLYIFNASKFHSFHSHMVITKEKYYYIFEVNNSD